MSADQVSLAIGAMLSGVETVLRSAAVLDDPGGKVCGIQPDGRPPPNCGQFYYAVHFAGLTVNDANSLSVDVDAAVTVTITARMGYAPRDRRGGRMAAAGELLPRGMRVGLAVTQDETHRDEANKLIPGTAEWAAIQNPVVAATTNGFLTPLKLANIGAVQEVNADWVGAAPDGDGENDIYTLAVSFVNANLVAYIGSV